MATISRPWTLPWIIGIAMIPVTALAGGFAVGYWTGGKPRPVEPRDGSVAPAASAPAPPVASGPATPGPAHPAPVLATPPPPKVTAPAPSTPPPTKVSTPAVEAPRSKMVTAPPALPQPPAPALAPVTRPRVEPAPAPPAKPRTGSSVPSAADIEACSRHASARMEGQDRPVEDAQDRNEDGTFREAYVSCLQARGFKRPGGND